MLCAPSSLTVLPTSLPLLPFLFSLLVLSSYDCCLPMPCAVLPAFPGSHCICTSVPCHPATRSRVLERSNMNGVYVCGERERTREKERLLARFLCQSLGACLQNAHTQFFSLLHPLMACTHKDTTCCHLRDGPDAHVVWRPVCSPVTNFPPLLWRYLTMPSWCVIVN